MPSRTTRTLNDREVEKLVARLRVTATAEELALHERVLELKAARRKAWGEVVAAQDAVRAAEKALRTKQTPDRKRVCRETLAAAEAARDDAERREDAIVSEWYRAKDQDVLVTRALETRQRRLEAKDELEKSMVAAFFDMFARVHALREEAADRGARVVIDQLEPLGWYFVDDARTVSLRVRKEAETNVYVVSATSSRPLTKASENDMELTRAMLALFDKAKEERARVGGGHVNFDERFKPMGWSFYHHLTYTEYGVRRRRSADDGKLHYVMSLERYTSREDVDR